MFLRVNCLNRSLWEKVFKRRYRVTAFLFELQTLNTFSSIACAISVIPFCKHLNLWIEGGNAYSGENFFIFLLKEIRTTRTLKTKLGRILKSFKKLDIRGRLAYVQNLHTTLNLLFFALNLPNFGADSQWQILQEKHFGLKLCFLFDRWRSERKSGPVRSEESFFKARIGRANFPLKMNFVWSRWLTLWKNDYNQYVRGRITWSSAPKKWAKLAQKRKT